MAAGGDFDMLADLDGGDESDEANTAENAHQHQEVQPASDFGHGAGRARSRSQLLLLAATGRAAKARKLLRRSGAEQGRALRDYAQALGAKRSGRAPRLCVRKAHRKHFGWTLKLVDASSMRFSRKCTLNYHEMLRIALRSSTHRGVVAEQYDVSTKTIRRVRACVGRTLLELQLHQIKILQERIAEHPPDFAVIRN